jgi:outer membrane protein assembly factor BamB
MTTAPATTQHARRHHAEVAREYVPIPDRGRVHGVTFDGKHVWFARNDEIVAFDPERARVVRRIPLPGASAGTAFDGEHLYQIAKDDIVVVDPREGSVVRRFRAPSDGNCSGMAWADGYLFIGQYSERRIHKVDAKTGAVVKTLVSDRLVTGVSCVDGALWHGASDEGGCELRRLGPDGTVEEALEVPVEHIAGVEADGSENGTVRLVRRKQRG